MTCSRCHYQFCWNCASRWRGGCTSRKTYCFSRKILSHPKWGSTIPTRIVTKTLAVPVGIAVAGTGTAIALGVGSIVVSGGVIAAAGAVATMAIASPVYFGVKYGSRLRVTSKGLILIPSAQQQEEGMMTVDDMVVHGIRVLCPWSYTDAIYQNALLTNNYSSFIGLPGRVQHQIFIAYFDNLNLGRRTYSALLYFVPFDVPYADQVELMPTPMIEVNFPKRYLRTFNLYTSDLNDEPIRLELALEVRIALASSAYPTSIVRRRLSSEEDSVEMSPPPNIEMKYSEATTEEEIQKKEESVFDYSASGKSISTGQVDFAEYLDCFEHIDEDMNSGYSDELSNNIETKDATIICAPELS